MLKRISYIVILALLSIACSQEQESDKNKSSDTPNISEEVVHTQIPVQLMVPAEIDSFVDAELRSKLLLISKTDSEIVTIHTEHRELIRHQKGSRSVFSFDFTVESYDAIGTETQPYVTTDIYFAPPEFESRPGDLQGFCEEFMLLVEMCRVTSPFVDGFATIEQQAHPPLLYPNAL